MHFSVTHFLARRLRQAPQKAFTRIVYQIGIVSVAIGLATTLIAFSVMEGFQQNITQKLMGFSGQLQVVKYSSNRTHEIPPIDQAKLQGIQKKFSSKLQAAKAVAYKAVLLQASDELEGVVCKGLDSQATHENLHSYLTAGRLIEFSSQGYSHEVVLSKHIADRLQVQVGDEVVACVVQQQARYRKLRVVGLYATHIEELDERFVFCDLRLIQRLNNWPANWVGGYDIFLRDHRATRVMAKQLRNCIDYDLRVKTTEREYMAIFDWLHIVQKNALIFMVLILLVMCSNLASIVLIQVMERTSMIGILKTLGASNGQIRRTMLWNNLYMLSKGIFWGNLVGIGLFLLQYHTHFMTLDPIYYHVNHVPMAWSWHTMGWLNVLATSVALTALLVATSVIIWLRPIKALKL